MGLVIGNRIGTRRVKFTSSFEGETSVNRAPSDIALSAESIAENNAIGEIIGAFSATDADAGNTFVYSLVAGIGATDNASFTIDGANLKAAEAFNYETKSAYSIRVRVTDQGGLYFEKVFAISVTNVNESAVITLPTASDITDTTAMVGATIDCKSLETTWSIEYGATNAYGSTKAGGTTSANGAKTIQLTGLTPNATIHWRFKAVNADGTTYGDDQTLSTVLYVKRVTEVKSRIANQNTTYSGTIRNVPGTYATLSAAYSASVNGDIIQLADGTYNLASESGGYWLINSASKGVLVRGNAANPAGVKLTCSSAAYGVRMRDCAPMTFQDLTLESTGTAVAAYMDQPYSARWVKFKNVVFAKTTSAKWLFERTSLSTDTNTIHIEFDGCTFNMPVDQNIIQYASSGINETLLITNCTFNKTDSAGVYSVLSYLSNHKGKLAIYDSTLNTVKSLKIIQVGEDEAVPTNTTFSIDIRNNSLNYTGAYGGHGLLIGRGTTKVYCVNNTINEPVVNDSLAIGMIIKTASANLGDSYFAGNKIIAPRPLYIKGGQKNYIRHNTAIGNQSGYGGLELNNPATDRLSTLNHVKKNTFAGKLAAMVCYQTASVENIDVTMQGWAMDENYYHSASGDWAKKADGTFHQFATKETFWSNSNDSNSKLLTDATIQSEVTIVDDVTLN